MPKPPASTTKKSSPNPISWSWVLLSLIFGIVAVTASIVLLVHCDSAKETGPLQFLINWRCKLVRFRAATSQEQQTPPPTKERQTPPPAKERQTPPPTKERQAPPPTKEQVPLNTEYPGQLVAFAAGHCIKKTTSTSEHECGEDAFSVSIASGAPKTGRTFLGVADGVGGWGLSGGDSSKVSTGLLAEMKSLASSTKLSLSEIAKLAFDRLASKQIHKQGSTTLCTALLDHEKGRLDISNVGDSGAFVIREGKLLMKTKLGVEGFNAPHQVGFDDKGNPYGSIQLFESRSSVFLRPGDIIVIVTDGVLDNLYEQEIVTMTVAMVGPIADRTAHHKVSNMNELDNALQERLKSASTTLAWHSWARSNETQWKSPFAMSAISHGYMFSGG